MSITKNDKNTRTTGRPTLNEVARRAGVSPITASRALRGVASVAEELAQKVRDAARELGYVVTPRRALASAQSHSVAVLVPSLANLLFIETLEAIHAVLRPQGLEVLIGNFHYSRNEEEDLIRNYLAYQPRGLLLTGFERTESARRMIEASGIPCVYMMDLDSGAGLNCVGFSQLRAGEAAAEHLLARGRRRLAYIGAQLDQRTLLRGEGFRRALQKPAATTRGWKSLRRGRPRWPSAANSSCSCWPASRRSTGCSSATTTWPRARCWRPCAVGSRCRNRSPCSVSTTCRVRTARSRA